MAQECDGIMGTILGHKIKSLIKKHTPQPIGNYEGCRLEEVIDAYAVKEYEVLCVRCGMKPDDKVHK